MSGTWQQVGRSFPLVLKRTEHPAVISQPLAETAYSRREGSDLQGFWNGTLKVKDTTLRLALAIAKLPDGTFQGAMDSIDQGAKGIPMTTLSVKPEAGAPAFTPNRRDNRQPKRN